MKRGIHHLGYMVVIMLCMGCTAGNSQKRTTANVPQEAELRQAEGVASRQLGDVKVTWIRDNSETRLMAPSLFSETPENLPNYGSFKDGIPASVSTFLVESKGVQVLVDAGRGASDSRLISNLKAIGISPEAISYVYVTHFHGDHIGGMLNGNAAVFPNAQVFVSQTEHDSWLQMPEERKTQVVRLLEAYKGRIHLFAFGDTLPGNIVALDATGHTPGHAVFQAGDFLIIGDLIHGAALQLQHPEYCASFDMDKERAIENRKKILEYARTNGKTMAGMHLPEPAFIDQD